MLLTVLVSEVTLKVAYYSVLAHSSFFFLTACVGCDESPGRNQCYPDDTTGVSTCCNVYVNDMCATDCPDDGIYIIDPDTAVCRKLIFIHGLLSYFHALLLSPPFPLPPFTSLLSSSHLSLRDIMSRSG